MFGVRRRFLNILLYVHNATQRKRNKGFAHSIVPLSCKQMKNLEVIFHTILLLLLKTLKEIRCVCGHVYGTLAHNPASQ